MAEPFSRTLIDAGKPNLFADGALSVGIGQENNIGAPMLGCTADLRRTTCRLSILGRERNERTSSDSTKTGCVTDNRGRSP